MNQIEKAFELVVPGMSLTEVMKTLRIDDPPVQAPFIADPHRQNYYDFGESGVKVFFDTRNVVRTVCFFQPFSKIVRGIAVGMKARDAIEVLGKPARRWPVADGIDRFVYDQPTFLRIDLDAKSGCISHIFL